MSPFPFRRATIRRAGEASAGMLAALAAWELALRPIGPQLREPPRAIVACDSLESAVVPTRQTEEGIALARFSICGARLTGRSPVAGGGARFVVLLGDSYVVAREVNDDETMGGRLEEMARADGRPLNVRQYGWIGVAPAQYLLVADDVLRRWHPDRVVVVLSDDDLGANAVKGQPPRIRILPGGRIEIDTTARQRPRPPRGPGTLALGTLLEQRWAMVLARAPALVRRAFGHVGGSGLIDEHLIPEVPGAVVRALSGAYGRRLLVVYLPDVRVTGGDNPGPQESLLLDACKAHAVDCVSMRRAMLDERRAGRAVRGFPTTVAGIGHLNAHGHRVIAREIWSAMKAGL